MREVIGRRWGEFVRWLSEVVAVPSVNPRYPGGTGEGAVQVRLAALLAAEGIVATLQPVDREATARFTVEGTVRDVVLDPETWLLVEEARIRRDGGPAGR